MPDQADGTRRYELEQFFAVRRYLGNLAFSPSGEEVAYVTDTSGQFNLWRQPAVGGYAVQMTLFEDRSVRGLAWPAHGGAIYLLADANGDEFYQIYRLPERGGRPVALTAHPQTQYQLSPEAVSPDGVSLAFAGNERSPVDVDVVVLDLASGARRALIAESGYHVPVSWSPDARSLLVLEVRSNTNQDLHLVALDGARRHLTPHEGDVICLPGPWLPDGSGFFLITDRGHETAGLAFYDLAAGGIEWLETPPWDVEDVALSHDGQLLAWSVNENGFSRLYVRDLTQREAKRLLKLPQIPAGTIEALTWAPRGRALVFRYSGPRQAGEVYLLDLDTQELRRLTLGMLGGIPEQDLVEPEAIHFPTFDGRPVPGLLYRPHGATAARPCAAILSIHGGPEAQERPNYQPFYQYLLHRGIAVLAPNIRGSSGYGKSYQMEIHRDWGGKELRDIEAAAQYLQGLEWVDGGRLGVYGGSFGGFATLSAISRLPPYWAAAVDIVGPSNLVTFARAVPPTWRRFMAELLGDPEADRDLLVERSPITYVDQIRAPLLVIQGQNDPRVVKSESDQMVERLRARGAAVDYLVFEDEGHGFTRRGNQLTAYRRAAEFFEQRLTQ